MFDRPPTAIITDQDTTICKKFDQVVKKASISITSGTLGNMSLSIFRDTVHIILTSIRFIGDGLEAIYSPSLRGDGITYIRNSMFSHGDGYLRCTRNAKHWITYYLHDIF